MNRILKTLVIILIFSQACTDSETEGIHPENEITGKTKSKTDKQEPGQDPLWYSFGFDTKGNAGCPREPGNCIMPPVVIKPSSLAIINTIFDVIATGNQPNIQTEFQNHSGILADHVPAETIQEVSLGNLFVTQVANAEDQLKFMLFHEDLNDDSILEVPFAYE